MKFFTKLAFPLLFSTSITFAANHVDAQWNRADLLISHIATTGSSYSLPHCTNEYAGDWRVSIPANPSSPRVAVSGARQFVLTTIKHTHTKDAQGKAYIYRASDFIKFSGNTGAPQKIYFLSSLQNFNTMPFYAGYFVSSNGCMGNYSLHY